MILLMPHNRLVAEAWGHCTSLPIALVLPSALSYANWEVQIVWEARLLLRARQVKQPYRRAYVQL